MELLSSTARDLFPLVWSGLITGCLYALGALGLVMIFKSSRVVNFSHGNVAGFAAFLIYGFSSGLLLELSWGMAVLLTILAVIAIAFATYAVISPLVFESDLTATIATLGVGLIAQGATLLIFGADIVSLDLPVPRFSMSVLGLFVTGYDLTVLAVAIVTIGALFFVIDFTKLGIAFRAISENPFAAEVCGLNLRSIHLFSWSNPRGCRSLADRPDDIPERHNRCSLHAAGLCRSGDRWVCKFAGKPYRRVSYRRADEPVHVLCIAGIQQHLSARGDPACAQHLSKWHSPAGRG